MDNCVKDNKNCHLLAFLSLLIARETFEKVQLRFLVVGHTHEDIDGSFGYLFKKLKEKNNYVIVDLMKAFMFSQDHAFIPQLIQEIPNFKSWVNGYLNNYPNVFVGCIVATLTLGSRPRQGVARLRAKRQTRESHHMLPGLQKM
jgi:hypothetical protein